MSYPEVQDIYRLYVEVQMEFKRFGRVVRYHCRCRFLMGRRETRQEEVGRKLFCKAWRIRENKWDDTYELEMTQ